MASEPNLARVERIDESMGSLIVADQMMIECGDIDGLSKVESLINTDVQKAVEAALISYQKDALATHEEMVKEAVAAARAEEREDCAKVAENGRFLHDDAPDAKFGKACAEAIRRGAKP